MHNEKEFKEKMNQARAKIEADAQNIAPIKSYMGIEIESFSKKEIIKILAISNSIVLTLKDKK